MPDTAQAPAAPSFVVASFRPLPALLPYAQNSVTHSDADVEQLAAAIMEYGFTKPILADEKGIVAGHRRKLALALLFSQGKQPHMVTGEAIPPGMAPVIDCTGWSETQRKGYIIWDNQSAAAPIWNEFLPVELLDLRDHGFDMTLTGFSLDDVDSYIKGLPSLGGGDEEGLSENYSRKIEAPIYRVTGERPAVGDLLDESKTIALQDEIQAAPDLPDDVRDFLMAAAERHTVFNFRRIAEFYAHADAATQRLMERSALVIIDFNAAIENGFVRLSEGMMEQAELSKARMAERDAK